MVAFRQAAMVTPGKAARMIIEGLGLDVATPEGATAQRRRPGQFLEGWVTHVPNLWAAVRHDMEARFSRPLSFSRTGPR